MRLHPFFHVLLHFLLSAVDLPTVQSYPSRHIGSKPGDVAKRVSGDDYGPVSEGNMSYRTCDHDGYFNPDNWNESGAPEAYVKWSMLVNKTSEAWLQRESEPNFFLRDVLNWSDLDCGITYKGCIGMPTCDEILTRTQNETTARQIYFIVLSMHNLNLISGVVNEQSVPAQANVASMAGNMANTFFWKHSDEVQRKCILYMNVMKGLLTALVTATFVFMPFVAGGLLGAEEIAAADAAFDASYQAATKAVETAQKAVIREAAAVEETIVASEAESVAETNLVAVERESAAIAAADGPASERASLAEEQTMLGEELEEVKTHETVTLEQWRELRQDVDDTRTQAIIARTNVLKTRKTYEAKKYQRDSYKPTPWGLRWMSEEARKSMTNFANGPGLTPMVAFGGFPMVVAGSDAENHFCAKYPNVPKEAQGAHELQLDTDIRKAAVNFRVTVQEDVALINRGAGFGDNGTFLPFDYTVMADKLFAGYYVKLASTDHLRFVEEPSRIEADITNHFKNALISAMLKEELCFLHCTSKNPDEVDRKMTASEFEPVPGTLCQAQCWRNWRKGKSVELYGLYELLKPSNDWNLNLRDFVSTSFKHWQDHRFDQRDQNLFPTVDEILTVQATSSSGSFLPVCYSELTPPVSLSDNKAVHELPCVCGNNRGNETKLFYKEAGFDKWVANKDGKGVALACQLSMSKKHLPPLLVYLLLCDINWHFPLAYENGSELQPGAEDQCDKVRELQTTLRKQGHDDHNINCRICFDSPVGSLIKQTQQDASYDLGYFNRKNQKLSEYNFRTACQEYDQDPNTACLY